jgi:hypothetical protein
MAENVRNDPAARLAEALVADLLKLSDAELLDELGEAGADPERDASAARAMIAAALIRTARVGSGRAPKARATQLAPANIASNDDGLANELTLAARNGRGLSSRELQDIVENLRELGALGGEEERP